MVRHVFVDETKQHGDVAAAAVVVVEGDVEPLRRVVRGLVLPGQRRLHMKTERDGGDRVRSRDGTGGAAGHLSFTEAGHDERVTTSDAPAVPVAVVMSAVGVHREMRRRHLDAWTVWAGYLSLGGTVTFPELAAALAGTAELNPQQTYLLVQALNL